MSLGSRYNQHSFAHVPNVNTPRSKFNRSKAVKTTMNFDYVTPIYADEALPGDTMNLTVKSFVRLAPQVVPLMDNMYIDFHSFFVPCRLVWDNFQKFMGEQRNPGDSTDYLVPQTGFSGGTPIGVGSIFDQMGIPVPAGGSYGSNISFNALPFRAYNLIWNEWFRDQNLQNSIQVLLDDGPDPQSTYQLRFRGKRHDYFSSALPWPQKGAAIELPLGSTAPVLGTFTGYGPSDGDKLTYFRDSNGVNTPLTKSTMTGAPTNVVSWSGGVASTGLTGVLVQDSIQVQGDGTGLYADLTDATAATINQFRQAIMMQSLLELDARGGTRYTEILRAHFNVISPDQRLQRPEFLSGGTAMIEQHVVAQSSASEEGSPQGNLAAFSTSFHAGNGIGFSKSFVEHGYVLVLASARADLTYQQGLSRMWNRRTRWDFFWPKFQELGEQEILNKEIRLTSVANDDNGVFGYQERYAEYRYNPSEIRGQFRSSYSESLDVWHLAEYFDGPVSLNSSFIVSQTPIERSLVVPHEDYPHLLCDFWFDIKHARPMVAYGVPASLGRF